MPSQPSFVGVIMLDSRFPRVVGDIGNPRTLPFPLRYLTVPKATPDAVVRKRLPAQSFITAAKTLADAGARLITTSCGFLVLHQKALQRAVPVPVLTSALLQGEAIRRRLPAGKHLTVLTASRQHLTAAHLTAAGLPPDTPVVGMPQDGHFHDTFLNNQPKMNKARIRREVAAAAAELRRTFPDTGAVLMECTNMPPYAEEVQQAAGCAVYDIRTALQAALAA